MVRWMPDEVPLVEGPFGHTPSEQTNTDEHARARACAGVGLGCPQMTPDSGDASNTLFGLPTAGDAARSIYSGVRVYACACGAHEAEGPMAHEGEVLR